MIAVALVVNANVWYFNSAHAEYALSLGEHLPPKCQTNLIQNHRIITATQTIHRVGRARSLSTHNTQGTHLCFRLYVENEFFSKKYKVLV